MATTRGKGTPGTRPPSETDKAAGETHPRTRAPEDEIAGTAAPDAAVQAPAPGQRTAPGAGVADADADTPAAAPAAETPASRGRGRSAPGTGVAEASPPAAPPALKKSGGRKKRETYVETAARRRREKEVDQLQADLRAFAIARPAGWNHEDWMAFLAHLSERGHDVSDQAVIGSRLEQERLGVALTGIEGLGPKRVDALVQRFQTLWSMRHADAASIAGVPGMTRPLAERVVQQLRERYA